MRKGDSGHASLQQHRGLGCHHAESSQVAMHTQFTIYPPPQVSTVGCQSMVLAMRGLGQPEELTLEQRASSQLSYWLGKAHATSRCSTFSRRVARQVPTGFTACGPISRSLKSAPLSQLTTQQRSGDEVHLFAGPNAATPTDRKGLGLLYGDVILT
jgi:hypothetical protein